MNVAISQMECALGQVAANLETMARDVRRAADAGCDVVVFPEMADTGYHMAAIHEHAGSWDGPGAYRELCGLAAEHGVTVVAGLSDRREELIYNAAVVIDASGHLVADYRKIHLFSFEPICEDQHIAAGAEPCTFELDGWRCGLMICYDLRFPELARTLALHGAQVLFVIAAWPIPRIAHWTLLTAARAVENQLYVVAVNRAGTDGGTTFGGAGRIFDPLGRPLVACPEAEPDFKTATLDPATVTEVRNAMRTYDDRRPATYRAH